MYMFAAQLNPHLMQQPMKKTLLALAGGAISFAGFAQELTDSPSDFKPTQGDVTAELNLFSNGIFNDVQNPLSLNSGQLRFRYFLGDQVAARIGFGVASASTTNQFPDDVNDPDEIGTQKRSASQIGLTLGIEKHFSGAERLSTYAGADILLAFTSAKETWEDYDGDGYEEDFSAEVKGTWSDDDDPTYGQAGLGLGLRLVGGADYYIAPKLYLGGEFGFGFLYNNPRDIDATFDDDGDTTEVEQISPVKNSISINPSVTGAIRIGFRF